MENMTLGFNVNQQSSIYSWIEVCIFRTVPSQHCDYSEHIITWIEICIPLSFSIYLIAMLPHHHQNKYSEIAWFRNDGAEQTLICSGLGHLLHTWSEQRRNTQKEAIQIISLLHSCFGVSMVSSNDKICWWVDWMVHTDGIENCFYNIIFWSQVLKSSIKFVLGISFVLSSGLRCLARTEISCIQNRYFQIWSGLGIL